MTGEATTMPTSPAIHTLAELRASGWRSRSVKAELRTNFEHALAASSARGDRGAAGLFPGILGYDDTVLPELATAIIAGHDILFLGEKGQGKSRLMRMLPNFLDEWLPYLDIPGCAVHEDPEHPITRAGREMCTHTADRIPIAWWRNRPVPACCRHQHGLGRRLALWPGSAHAPRHLCHERTARP